MEDTSGFEEAPSGPAAAMEAVKKFGIGKLLIIVIILGAALWFFVLAPKPGTLSVTVKEIDSGDYIDGVQLDLTPPGQKTVTKFSTSSSSVRFDNVPSMTTDDLDLQIVPPEGYQVVGSPASGLKLESGKPKSISVTLAQKTNLKVSVSSDKVSLGTGCTSNLAVSVTNGGDAPATVQLVGDEKLKEVIQSEAKTVSAKSTTTFSANLSAPDKKGPLSGKIRARLTNSGDSFTLDVTDPEELRVSPERLEERVSPGSDVDKQFTIENSGRSGEARDIQAIITGDLLQLNPQLNFADNAPLKPREEKILTVQFTAPSVEGKTVGVMIVSSACQRIQVPISVTVQER
ncbi:hypothetical protein HY994_02875 [Candidatus Micrarchaeota archaeon]|nr:hypothetical protein [Candidatus Micrarchaeota archaeon]